jgi:uncharacterized protein YegP (UPF0339 family)
MRKFLCSLALFAGIGVLVVSVSSPAPAQPKDKKDVKKDDKKDAKKEDKKDEKKDEPGKVEVYQAKDGWRFRIAGPDGKTVAIGVQGFAKKDDCLSAVEVVKATLGKVKVTEVMKD